MYVRVSARVPPAEGAARGRAAGLVEDGGALPGGLGQVGPRDLVVAAGVVDVVHLGRVGVDPALAVLHDGVVLPGALPQLVEDLQVLVGDLVAVVVVDLVLEAEVACRVGEVGGHHVPGDPAAGQVVEGAHPAGEGERRLVGGGEGRREAEALGDRGHGRDDEQRVVVGDLDGLGQGGLGAAPEAVVGADHVREEHRVERAVLQQTGELQPELDVVEAVACVVGVDPQAVRDVPDAVHLEQVDVQFLTVRHVILPLLRAGARRPAAPGCKGVRGG
jgi:hypothetical protein